MGDKGNRLNGWFPKLVTLASTFTALVLFSRADQKGLLNYSRADVIVSYLLLCGAIIMEMASIFIVISSVGKYFNVVQDEEFSSNHCCKKESDIIFSIVKLVHPESRPQWSQKLPQYNLIRGCIKVKSGAGSGVLIRIMNVVGIKHDAWTNAEISHELKKFVLDKLLQVASRIHEDVWDISKFTGQWAKLELQNKRQERSSTLLRLFAKSIERPGFFSSVLTWHIVTDICFFLDDKLDCNDSPSYRTPSKELSNYVMYLCAEHGIMSGNDGHILLKKFQEFILDSLRSYKESLDESVVVSTGDAGGDLATPTPVIVRTAGKVDGSPEWLRGSRFWLLQPSDDEEEGLGEESPAIDEDTDYSLRYMCRSPAPVTDRDIVEDSSELARRTLKRIRRRDAQRMAAKAAMAFASPQGMNSTSPLPWGKVSAKIKNLVRPIMEPSVFVDDSTEGWTIVRRRRWPPVIDALPQDPKIKENSNLSSLGLARLRASPNHNRHWCNPLSVTNRSDGDRRQAKVGSVVAGRAFRGLLGLAWSRIEKGEPVLRRQDRSSAMNGDGQGGFNPGRGGFNAGRGGHQGRGGYQGRGAFHGRTGYQGRGVPAARGRQGMGGVRGGHGYGASRGFQGNAANSGLGGARNFVQGESSGTGGMNHGNHQDNWGSSNGFHRNPGYNNGGSYGHGGNQQRWNVPHGGGLQYRPRDNEQPRSGIDVDLLHQTVQAVVAAVAAATKNTEPTQPHVVANTENLAGGTDQHVMTSVAAPNAVPLPTQNVQDTQIAGAKGKDNEGQGALKKKKEDKTGCFRCKQPGHYIDDCPVPFCDLCNGSQEVDMDEAKNGTDRDGDAKNGKQNNGGGNAMDMDPKGIEEGDTSNNIDQDGHYENNGVDGMQLQAQPMEEIKVGSINIQLSRKDTLSSAQNLAEKHPFFESLPLVENVALNDNFYADYNTDLLPNGSTSGLPQGRVSTSGLVVGGAGLQGTAGAVSPSALRQLALHAAVVPLSPGKLTHTRTCSSIGQQAVQWDAGTRGCATPDALGADSEAAAVPPPSVAQQKKLDTDSSNGFRQREGHCAVATSGRHGTRFSHAGSSVPVEIAVADGGTSAPAQKIHAPVNDASGLLSLSAVHDDGAMIGENQLMIGAEGICAMGSSVPVCTKAIDGAMNFGRDECLDALVMEVGDKHKLSKRVEEGKGALQISMGIASSTKTKMRKYVIERSV
ncbi:hypothetical protein ACQ4PT_015705 [Festuca glaucescens]